VNNTRQGVGILDASTLGKIIVKGPDAGRFLDMLYTNRDVHSAHRQMPLRADVQRTGLPLRRRRRGPHRSDTWLCHTTSGGADRIHAWMEDWLQCEWWDWQVYTANVTEQYAQIAVVGPNAREVLEKLGGMDVSQAKHCPSWAGLDGHAGGHPGAGLPHQLLGRVVL
jgi:sarcosine oxidase, subunit alpha